MDGLLADPVDGPLDEPYSAPPDWENPPRNEPARNALRFIQSCPHTKGDLRRQRRSLGDTWLPWQERLTRHLFGTLEDNGLRIYRTVHVEMPKKSGKSHFMAAVMLYLLGPAAEPGSELYSAGYDHGQAMVVWDLARQMCEIAGWNKEKLEIRDYQGCWEIENPESDSVYEPLTRKALSKHGFNPYAVCFDELHTQPDRELWDTIDGSQGAWDEPLLMAITNSGHDRQSVCYKQREYAIENNRERFDDSFLGLVYGLEEEFEGVGEPEDWKRANPGVPVTVDLEWYASKAEKAKRVPSELDAHRRWRLGIWTRAATAWFRPEDIARCEDDYSEGELQGWPCYGGLDLGVVHDLSAWVLLFRKPGPGDVLYALCRTFCPEARLTDPGNPYRKQYQAWEREGHLIVTDGRSTDHDAIRRQVLHDAEVFEFRDMAMDRYQGIQLSKELSQALSDEERERVAGMGQGYSSMSGPCMELERRIYQEEPTIRHNGDPVLTWALNNVSLQVREPGERMKPTKDNPDIIKDPVDALLMALDRAMRWEEVDAEPEQESVYVRRAEEDEEASVIRSL